MWWPFLKGVSDMSHSLAVSADRGPRLEREPARKMAKAVLTNREHSKSEIGAALQRALNVLGLSIKEGAGLLEMDPAQMSRWIAGTERLQIERVWGTRLHGPFAIEVASAAAGVTVETTVTLRRTA